MRGKDIGQADSLPAGLGLAPGLRPDSEAVRDEHVFPGHVMD
jgi:hypothetical protein